MNNRIGLGSDIHQIIKSTKKGSGIYLGGFFIPTSFIIKAHSDGDVLLHALTDAILGAMGLGDIGDWFSDEKKENKNRKSKEFIDIVLLQLKKMGWKMVQIDSTIFLDSPKLYAYKKNILDAMEKVTGLKKKHMNIKAKTFEGLFTTKRKNFIFSQVIVQLQKK